MTVTNRYGHSVLSSQLLRQEPVDPSATPLPKDNEYFKHPRSGSVLTKHGRMSGKELDDLANTTGKPLQGLLFHPKVGRETEEQRREAAGSYPVSVDVDRERVRTSVRGRGLRDLGLGQNIYDYVDIYAENKEHQLRSSATRAMRRSKMPAALIRELQGDINVSSEPYGGAIYTPGSGDIDIDPSELILDEHDMPETIPSHTLLHELGHRADYRSHAREGIPLTVSPPMNTGDNVGPNPRAEGIADGFSERYSPSFSRSGSFGHYKAQLLDVENGMTRDYIPTYSTSYKPWRGDRRDAAIYAAARAHFVHTGENPAGTKDKDEYLHKMVSTSPHAVRALRQTGLKDVGAESFDAYRKLRKVGTQMSLLDPSHEYDVYDIPEDHKRAR